jgi:hypothetical protein
MRSLKTIWQLILMWLWKLSFGNQDTIHFIYLFIILNLIIIFLIFQLTFDFI